MSKPENQTANETHHASRGQNAIRVAKYGLIAGAVVGLFQGGGIGAALLMGGKFALGSAVIGAVAGNKLNPFLDKFTSFLPFMKSKGKSEGVAPAIERKVEAAPISLNKPRSTGISTGEPEAVLASDGSVPVGAYNPMSSVSSDKLESLRAESSASLATAGENMDADAPQVDVPGAHSGLPDQWQSRQAAGRRVTHPGTAALN